MATLPPVGAEPGALQANTIKLTKKIENTIPQNKLIFFIVFITFLLSIILMLLQQYIFVKYYYKKCQRKSPRGDPWARN
jgi:hypothetical protein